MDERIYFNPGDIVQVRHTELKYRPIMVVLDKKSMLIRDFKPALGSAAESITGGKGRLLGIECFWFDQHDRYCKEVFNTKDLIHF